MIECKNGLFVLNTQNTTYAFRKMDSGQLEHLYYGGQLDFSEEECAAAQEKCKYPAGNLITYSAAYPEMTLENINTECSSYGKGDIREPFVVIENTDGSYTSDFIYESYDIKEGHDSLEMLPSAYGDSNEVMQLIVRLNSLGRKIKMELIYTVYEKSDCITRSSRIINKEEQPVRVMRLMSSQLDFNDSDYNFINFTGAWTREMHKNVSACIPGKIVNSSNTGCSSNRNNPFVMLARPYTTEKSGECYGFNLVYSGNHYTCANTDSFNQLRIISGINPENFSWALNPDEVFETPEAVMTFSENGFGQMSNNLHQFVNNHVVRGTWKQKERPILINSWEAYYFKFNETKLLKLAKKAKQAGVELFVLDDGWFGKRDNDSCSLGDWKCNTKKIPSGLKGLAKKINEIGLDFGIWVEPEMVNADSECYRKHPEWAVQIPGYTHSEGRNQKILNLTIPEVRDYIVSEMSKVFSSGNISYVKWDMNRIFSDQYSATLNNQQEFSHRYICGLYDVLKRLTKAFPNILFEGCASGGNRFDLGMLCFMPQIWASDNTDAWCRADIQNGLSYGYPLSVMSNHVSGCPNHQTLRSIPIETRFNVAFFGVLGYECNLLELTKEEFEAVKEQIVLYKKYRELIYSGRFYRIQSGEADRLGRCRYSWICVSENKEKAVAMQLQDKAVATMPQEIFITKGLDDDKKYHFYNRMLKYNIKNFGDLINTVAPVHVKKDSIVHNVIARYVKMPGESENYMVSGAFLNKCGIKLKQNYCGTGFDENVRYYQDYASRLFMIESVENKNQ